MTDRQDTAVRQPLSERISAKLSRAADGVWDSINKTVQDVVGGQDAAGFNVENYVGMSRVMGFTILISAVDVVLITAIATLGAFLYNMAAALLGGIELTLAEDDHR